MRALVALLALAACADPAGPASREVTLATTVGADGLSPEVVFTLPEGSRSVTIVVEGAPEALYALGAFALGDRTDRIGLPGESPGPAMQMAYLNEQIGQMPGALYQSIRLGTFTHVYPYRPGQELVPGAAMIRVASDTPGPVSVRVLMPPDDGASVLPLNIYVVGDELGERVTPAFTAELERLLAQASITPRIDLVETITGTSLERIMDFSEPQEAPTSMSAMLPSLVADRETEGLDVFLVESLPPGVAGLALGTPGPPVRGSYYFGIVVRGDAGAMQLARVVAHEAGHFLALQHVQNVGVSGRTYPDPLDDTRVGDDNLMEGGTTLTPDQAFALSRSALLVAP